MARILWVACANPGSLFPAVPIALELTRRGHELTVLCVPSSQKTFESLGLGFRPARELARHLRRAEPCGTPGVVVAHLGKRRVRDDLLDAAAEFGARHSQSLDPTGYWAFSVRLDDHGRVFRP
jgi:hypothetical protein